MFRDKTLQKYFQKNDMSGKYVRGRNEKIDKMVDAAKLNYEKTQSKKIESKKRVAKSENPVRKMEEYVKHISKKEMYIWKFKYEWTINDEENWFSGHATYVSEAVNINEVRMMDAVKKAAIEEAKIKSNQRYEIEIQNVRVISVVKALNIQSLANLPVFRYKWSYPNLGLLNTNLGDSNTCGFDLLIDNYPKRVQKMGGREGLCEFFGKEEEDGLTPNDLLKFSEHHDLSCYVMDLNCKAIVQRNQTKVKNGNKAREEQALICTIASEHCYDIKDKAIREKIIKSVMKNGLNLTGQTVMQSDHQSKKNLKRVFLQEIPEEFNDDTAYYINKEEITDHYKKYLTEGFEIFAAKWVQAKVVSIYKKGGKIEIHAFKDYETVNQACKDFKLDFKNQSLNKVARQVFKQNMEERKLSWKETCFSKDLEYVFSNTKLCNTGAFNFVLPHTIKPNQKIGCLDIRRNYTAVADKGYFFYLDVNDHIREYKNENISHGFYYVETTNYWPLKGNGFYDFKVIQFCLERQLISKVNIKSFIKGRPSKDMDKCLKSFIEYVYNTSADDKVRKQLVNSLIGSFGSNSSTRVVANHITSSWEEACYYLYQYDGNANIIDIELENCKLYRVACEEEVIRFTNNLPVRMSIVQRANIEAYKLFEDVNNKKINRSSYIPIAVGTDAVFYLYNKHNAKLPEINPDKIGGYRQETKIPKEFKIEERKLITEKLELPELEWKELTASETEYFDYKVIMDYARALITGFAGSAKSYIIKQLQKEFKDTFAYAAFTHTAAKNVNGITLHNLLGLNFMTHQITPKSFKRLIKNKKGLIIDEVSMMPLEFYRILAKLPEDFKIYVFGDFRQILPIDEVSYENTKMMKQLVHGNKILLKKQCRADAEFANQCVSSFDSDNWDAFKQYKGEIKSIRNELNIVHTNLTRCLINEELVKKLKPKNAIKIANHEYFQYIYKELPLIGSETCEELKIYNGEHFEIISLTEKIVKIKSRFTTTEKELELSIDDILKYLTPAYAITVNKAQGATFNIPYSIWEFGQMNKHSRYTALTRATNKDLIKILHFTVPIENLLTLISGKPAYIYAITDGGKNYIGSTSRTIEERWDEHKAAALNGKSKLYEYMRKEGINKFTIKKLGEYNTVSDSHIKKIEQYFIDSKGPQLNERPAYWYN